MFLKRVTIVPLNVLAIFKMPFFHFLSASVQGIFHFLSY